MSDFNVKFMNKVTSLFVYEKPLNLYCTYNMPVDSRTGVLEEEMF